MTWLIHRACDAVTLHDALVDASPLIGPDAVCLLYLPGECVVARLRSDGSLERDGDEITGAGAFEARAFSSLVELRWTQDADERGRAVAIAEEGGADLARLDAGWWAAPDRIGPVDGAPVRYVLWGTSAGPGRASGWTRMRSPRTGDLVVPVECPPSDTQVYLHGREYQGRLTAIRPSVRDDGNVVVVEELLRCLSSDEKAR